jgi:nitroimidazol reductase NimA-like FMN-containing flavoprotein (pyridoxamine 5'-phosphate oxidase superfamily)
MISQLGERESRELLGLQRLGRLGCCLENEAYVVPVNYLLDDDCIYIHSLPGRKITLLRANPRACLQVDDIEDDYNWRSVVATGWYEEVSDAREREHKLAALFRHLPHLTPVESRMKSGAEQTILFRIRIERITGVCERWQ